MQSRGASWSYVRQVAIALDSVFNWVKMLDIGLLTEIKPEDTLFG